MCAISNLVEREGNGGAFIRTKLSCGSELMSLVVVLRGMPNAYMSVKLCQPSFYLFFTRLFQDFGKIKRKRILNHPNTYGGTFRGSG